MMSDMIIDENEYNRLIRELKEKDAKIAELKREREFRMTIDDDEIKSLEERLKKADGRDGRLRRTLCGALNRRKDKKKEVSGSK